MNNTMTIREVTWFVRGPKAVTFDLPPGAAPSPADARVARYADDDDVEIDVDAELASLTPNAKAIELDYSDCDRTSKREPYKADATQEIDPNDVLAEFPVDPTEPFELRVPQALLDRAALLKAALPRSERVSARAKLEQTVISRSPIARGSRIRQTGWVVATVLGVCVGVVLAAGLSQWSGPIADDAVVAIPAPPLKAAPAQKVLAAQAVALDSHVPTVSFDSLPRAR